MDNSKGRLHREHGMRGAHVHPFHGAPGSVQTKQPIAFLDRDGVLNYGREGYVNSSDELELLPGAAQSVAKLIEAGFAICVVTNQSPVMRGLWGLDRLQSIHEHLQRALLEEHHEAVLDMVITCPHRRRDMCSCRKPQPGMLALGHRLLREQGSYEPISMGLHQIDQEEVNWWSSKPHPPNMLDTMVGDRRSDMGAGWAYGARLFRVNAHVGLASVVDRVLERSNKGDEFQP